MTRRKLRIVAAYPHRRGLSYVILDEDRKLRDFGRRWIPTDKHQATLAHLKLLLETKDVDVLVLEDERHFSCRRREPIKRLLREMRRMARAKNIEVKLVFQLEVARTFEPNGTSNKHHRASLVSQLYPQLRDRRPPKRELWSAESECMGVFDAAGIALTHMGLPATAPEDEVTRLERMEA